VAVGLPATGPMWSSVRRPWSRHTEELRDRSSRGHSADVSRARETGGAGLRPSRSSRPSRRRTHGSVPSTRSRAARSSSCGSRGGRPAPDGAVAGASVPWCPSLTPTRAPSWWRTAWPSPTWCTPMRRRVDRLDYAGVADGLRRRRRPDRVRDARLARASRQRRGRAEIAEAMRSVPDTAPPRTSIGQPPGTGRRRRGGAEDTLASLTTCRRLGPAARLVWMLRYQDRFQRTPAGWRISHGVLLPRHGGRARLPGEASRTRRP